jgi:hypothetical protein
VSTLQLASHYCKIACPFASAALILMVAYGDHHKRWKLVRSISTPVIFLAVGCFLVFVG